MSSTHQVHPCALLLVAILASGCQTWSAPVEFTPTPNFGLLGAPGTYTARRTVSTCQDNLFFFWTTSRPSWHDALSRLPPSRQAHRLAYLSVDTTSELYWVGMRTCHRIDAVYVVKGGINFDATFPPRPQDKNLPLFMETAAREARATGERVEDESEQLQAELDPAELDPEGPTTRESSDPDQSPRLPLTRRRAVATLVAHTSVGEAVTLAMESSHVVALKGLLGARLQVRHGGTTWSAGTLHTLTTRTLMLEGPGGELESIPFARVLEVRVIILPGSTAGITQTLRFDTPVNARTSHGKLSVWVGSPVVIELTDGTSLRGRLKALEGTKVLLKLGKRKDVLVDLTDVSAISR